MAEIPLVMPKMSMTMEEGTLIAWHKAEGDVVRSGDVVCEVMTDKVDMEVESPVDGTLVRLTAQPEDVVAVGEPIAYLAGEGEDLLGDVLGGAAEVGAPAGDADAPARDVGSGTGVGSVSASGSAPAAVIAPAAPPARRVSAVPLARRMAVELGVELAALTGTGPGGVVRVVDVEAAGRSDATRPPGRSDASRPGGRRRAHSAIARQTAASAAVPQVAVFRDLDLTALEAHRGRLAWTGLLVRAYADALRGSPLNARWNGDGSEAWDSVAVALMVDTDRGPLAPVVTDPDRLAIGELDERIGRLTGQARRGRVPVAHLTAATSTVYDLGDLGVDAVQELLTPPQATLLSLGAVGPRPVPDGDGIGLRTRCRAGLTVDHRVGDGADAAHLLAAVQGRLDDPAWFGLR
jgi:pyruvate dehydrogenase E2 component (dihydrolipoamide acetyltransferase)